jgi:hypothetical protein
MTSDRQTTLRLPERLLMALEAEGRRNARTTAGQIRWALFQQMGMDPDAENEPAKPVSKKRKVL